MYTVNSYKLTKVYFVNQYTGFALSGAIWTVFNSPNSNFILKTTNSGINWRQITIGPSFVMNSISFVNSTTGVIAGSNGIILKSSDAGESWNQIKSGSVI